MMKISHLLHVFLLSAVISTAAIFAQDAQILPGTITAEKMRILILPAVGDSSEHFSIAGEVTGTVASVAVKLGRFEVIDRNNLRSILDEQALQQTGLVADSMIVEMGKLAASQEAIMVNVLNFSQIGVPPKEYDNDDDDDDVGFWAGLFSSVVEGIFSDDSEGAEPYAGNIETQLTVEIRNIDIATGRSEESFNVSVSHTGGSRGVSRAKAIENFRDVLIGELRMLYSLSSEVITVEGNEAILFLGAEVGVEKNTLFEIVEPDKYRTLKNRRITIPGRSAGLVCVTDLSSETNRSQIIRQWRTIEEGDLAVEYSGSVRGFQLYILPPFPEKNFQLGAQYHFQPIAAYDFGFMLRYSETNDSYENRTRGLGLGGFGTKQIVASSPVQLNAKLALEVDLFFKKDDENHSVYLGIPSAAFGMNVSLMLSRKSDCEINFGYRFTGPSSTWVYSEGDGNLDAVWNQDAPEVNLSGWFFTVGYKYILL